MPLTDFNQKAKNAYQTTNTLKLGGNFQVLDQNYYKRAVTIDNTGKTAKTDYYVAIPIDSFNLYLNFKINDSFSSLRVYDTDGITPLPFYLQNPGSDQCLVFVKIPSLPSLSKTIYFEYGNNGLPNASLDVNKPQENPNFWNFNRTNFRDWFYAQNCRRRMFSKVFNIGSLATASGTRYNDFVFNNVQNWYNHRNTANWGLFDNEDFASLTVPFLNGHTGFGTDVKINGLDTVYFNGNSKMDLQASTGGMQPIDNYNESYFACVFRTTSTVPTGIQRIIAGITGSLAFSINNRKFSINSPGTTTYVTYPTNLAGNTNYLIEAWIRPAGGQNFSASVRINNVTQTATGSHPTFPNNLLKFQSIGARSSSSNFLEGYIGEIIYCNDFATTSTNDTNFRNDIYEYLNTKYKIVGSSDFPTVTVGSETNISPTILNNYTGYNSISNYSLESNLENDFFGVELQKNKANIKKILTKPFISGRTNFTNTTLDLTNKISEKASREYNLTTTTTPAVSDDFSLGIDGDNYTELTTFQYEDIVNNTKYTSDDFDFITVELNTPTTDFDLSLCELQFSDTNTFTNNLYIFGFSNQKIASGLNVLVFRKSDFSLTGTLNWADVKFALFRLRLNTGTATVHFGNFKLVKDYENIVKKGDKIILGEAVSVDNNSTFSSQNISFNSVKNVFSNEKDLDLELENVLERFMNSRLDDLPGFIQDGRQFFAGKESEAFEPNVLFNNKILKRIFCLAFPYDLLDFQTEPDFRMGLDQNLFIARGEMRVKDVVNPLLNIYTASIFVKNGKIIYKTGFQKLYPISGSYETPIFINQDEILEYKENTSNQDKIYNSITVPTYFTEESVNDNVYYGKYLPTSDLPQPIEIPAGQTRDVFINLADFDNTRGDFNLYLDNIRLSNAQLSETENGVLNPASVLDVTYTGLRFLAPSTIVFRVKNNAFNTRWLRQVAFNAAFIAYYKGYPNSASNQDLVFEYRNTKSIKKFGKNEYPIGDLRMPASTTTSQPNGLASFWEYIIDNFNGLNNFKQVEITVNNNPDLEINTLVEFKDNQGILKSGVIKGINKDQANKKDLLIYLTS